MVKAAALLLSFWPASPNQLKWRKGGDWGGYLTVWAPTEPNLPRLPQTFSPPVLPPTSHPGPFTSLSCMRVLVGSDHFLSGSLPATAAPSGSPVT